MKPSYKMMERLRIATIATFISGFVNAYTYTTQQGSFAGVQSGNLLLLAISIGQGAFEKSITYIIPLIFFMLGQAVSYALRQRAKSKGYRWHIYVSGVLIVLMLIIATLSPHFPSSFTLAGLALFASIKVDTFKRVRDMTYASVMMTGNVKNMAHHFIKGWCEKDSTLLKHSFYTLLVLLSCIFGAILGTILSQNFDEYSLYFLLLPLILLYVILQQDH